MRGSRDDNTRLKILELTVLTEGRTTISLILGNCAAYARKRSFAASSACTCASSICSRSAVCASWSAMQRFQSKPILVTTGSSVCTARRHPETAGVSDTSKGVLMTCKVRSGVETSDVGTLSIVTESARNCDTRR